MMIVHLVSPKTKTDLRFVTSILRDLRCRVEIGEPPKRLNARIIYWSDKSIKSLNLDYYIYPLMVKKCPIMLLYPEKTELDPKIIQLGQEEKKLLKLRPFTSEFDIREILVDYIWKLDELAGSQVTIKFDQEIADYLDWASVHTGLRRSDIIKRFIGERLRKDKEYQKFLNS